MMSKGEQSQEEHILETSFNDPNRLTAELQWFQQPAVFKTAARNSTGLLIHMDTKTDFWQKTYYNPVISKDDGHILYLPTTQKNVVVETSFEIDAQNKFDQAGLIVRYDKDHWIKTGIEAVDGEFTIGAVVTNIHSDWTTQPWLSNKLTLRLYKLNTDFVVEFKDPNTETWRFIRICRLNIEEGAEVQLGLMACAPTDAGGSAYFSYLKYSHTTGIDHKA